MPANYVVIQRKKKPDTYRAPVHPPREPEAPPVRFGLIDKVRLTLAVIKAAKKPQDTPLMKSWKTTIFGTGGIGFLVFDVIAKLADGNAATNPEWGIVIPVILASAVGLFARDNKVSSEAVGAK